MFLSVPCNFLSICFLIIHKKFLPNLHIHFLRKRLKSKQTYSLKHFIQSLSCFYFFINRIYHKYFSFSIFISKYNLYYYLKRYSNYFPNLTSNTLPFPTSESAFTTPPSSSMIFFAKESPIPICPAASFFPQ